MTDERQSEPRVSENQHTVTISTERYYALLQAAGELAPFFDHSNNQQEEREPMRERVLHAVRFADEQTSETRRKLEGGLTPAEPHRTVEERIESEWCYWFDEAMRP